VSFQNFCAALSLAHLEIPNQQLFAAIVVSMIKRQFSVGKSTNKYR
jgi:hypothetical protein